MSSDPAIRARARTFATLILWGGLAVIALRNAPPPIEPTISGDPVVGTPLTVDLNQDPWWKLTLLDGIGESLARRIVAEREVRGGFRSIEEACRVPGVPDAALLGVDAVVLGPRPSGTLKSGPLEAGDASTNPTRRPTPNG